MLVYAWIPKNTVSGRPLLSPLLKFRDVTVIKGPKILPDSLTVAVHEGEHAAILGPNGAGKSSFMKAIMRSVSYRMVHRCPGRRGAIFRVCGNDVWHVSYLRSHFGIVSNELQYTFTREITGRNVVLSGFFLVSGYTGMRQRLQWSRKQMRFFGSLQSITSANVWLLRCPPARSVGF